jgi:putative spermidine/putrescine transport system permease protein
MVKTYTRGLWNGRLILSYTLLVCLSIVIFSPFVVIIVKSFGKGWFGKLWLPPTLTLDWYKWAVNVARLPEVMKNTIIVVAMPGKEVLMSMILLPRMIPPITYALGIARIFYGLNLVNTHFGIALAHVTLCAPYAILVMSATFEGLDERMLEAASVCGANPLRTFFHVTLPQIMPGILSSMIFTFTTSYNEFTLTLMTYGPDTLTLPIRTYLAVGEGYWEVTSAMSVIMVLPSLLILFLIQRQVKPEQLVGGFKGL